VTDKGLVKGYEGPGPNALCQTVSVMLVVLRTSGLSNMVRQLDFTQETSTHKTNSSF